jgi:probable HAF family extracellular repeat protein
MKSGSTHGPLENIMWPHSKTIIVLLTLLIPLAANADPIPYDIVILPSNIDAVAINNSGVIAGDIPIGSQIQAFVAQSGGPIVGIGTPPGGFVDVGSSQANAINSSGQVTGTLSSPSSPVSCGAVPCGFTYNNGVIETFHQGFYTSALAINDSGVVAGYTGDATSVSGFIYSNGVFQELGTLPGDTGSRAYGINNSGQVVGNSFNNNGSEHGFLYSNGTMQDLGTLPGDTMSFAWSINNLGQVTGQSQGLGGVSGFIYDPGTGLMTALGSLPDTGYQRPEDINDSGQIVGYANFLTSGSAAFLYSDGTMYNLDDLLADGTGWNLTEAIAINDSGEILAYGTYNGVGHEVILTESSVPPFQEPTPEPSARIICLMFAVAIGGVHQVRRWKRAAA